MILALWSAALCLSSVSPMAPVAPVSRGPQDLFVETRRMLPDPKPSGVRDVAAGDVDGDGDVDLLLGSDGPNLLWRNDLAGLFADASAQLPAVDERSYSVLLEDLDGDGDLDAYESDDHAGVIFGRVLENDGSGSFSVALTLVVPQGRPVAGDVDNDGDVDLFIGATLYRNVGPGLYLQADLTAFPPGFFAVGSIMLADLDGDGDLDAFLCPAIPITTALVCMNDGTGHFAAGVPTGFSCTRASFGDLDGDGDLDAYASVPTGSDLVLFNDGLGGLTAVPGPWHTFESLLDDTDGDGDLDVLALSGSAPGILRLANDGAGNLTDASASLPPAVGTTVNLVAADVDGDQDADLIATGGDSVLLWLNASGTYVEVQFEPRHQTGGAYGIQVGDLTGDGAPDALFYRGETPELALLANDGMGMLADAPALVPSVAPYVNDLDVFDADGDGDSDVLVGHVFGDAELLKNDGAGKLAEVPGAVPGLTVDVSAFPATGDLDGDGDTDVVRSWYLGASSTSTTQVWRNDGVGFFTAGGTLYSGLPAYDPGRPILLDADGDGDLDAFLIGTSLKFASVLLNDGAGGFGALPGSVLPGHHGTGGAAADVNADGAADVALATQDGVVTLINVGTGSFLAQSTLVGPWAGSGDVQLLDLDGDGDHDVLQVAAYTSADGAWMGFRNDGVGAFTYDAAYEQKGLNPRFADLDGDGDLDAVALRYDRLVQLTRVDGGQVAWRTPTRIGLPLPMEVFGAPGAPYALAASPGTASFPLAPFGTLLLDPSLIWLVAAGAIPAGGQATVNVPIGLDPSLLGLDFFWQALVGVPLRFTNADRIVVSSF